MTSEPSYLQALRELATEAGRFVDLTEGRPYFLAWVRPIFADPDGLMGALHGRREREAARELAAAALHIAELHGDADLQRILLRALDRLGPLASPQGEWVSERIQVS